MFRESLSRMPLPSIYGDGGECRIVCRLDMFRWQVQNNIHAVTLETTAGKSLSTVLVELPPPEVLYTYLDNRQ